MNKKIIWGIVIVVILIGGGFAYNYMSKPALICWPYCPGMTDQDREDIKKSAFEAETADWETYTNTLYGFEFKYPKEWIVNDTSKGADFATLEYSVYPPCDSSECNDRGPLIQIDLLKRNFSEYIGNEDFSSKSTYTLSGKTGFVINSLGHSIYAFEKEGKAFTIIVSITTDTQERVINEQTHQIFSTFKFISSTNVATNEQKVIATAKEVIGALNSQDYQKLEGLVSPDGLSYSFYPSFTPNSKNIIPKNEVSKIPEDKKLYLWGYTDGKGDPINLTRAEVLAPSKKVDFSKAPDVAVNKTLGGGNSVNTIEKDANGRTYVAFHFSGFDSKYAGMDWKTMYLIFDFVNNEYKLRGIAWDYWTI